MNIAEVEDLEAAVLRAGGLADRYQRRDPLFGDAVLAWLAELEGRLQRARLPAAAGLAALRAELVAVGRGAPPRDVASSGKLGGRALREAAAARALGRGEALVQEALAPRRRQLQEGAELAGQLAAAAQHKGLLAGLDPAASHGDRLREVWARLCRDRETAVAATLLLGRLGSFDVLVLLDRALGPALP